MKKDLPRRYWDSSCFIAWLKGEEERKQQCEEVIQQAESGKLELVTSAVSLVEVVKLDKGPLQITLDKAELIKQYFQNEYIVVVQVSRFIAERARELVWSNGLKPRDAIHVATALYGELLDFDTFDRELIGLNGTIPGCLIKFGEPQLPQRIIHFPGATSQKQVN